MLALCCPYAADGERAAVLLAGDPERADAADTEVRFLAVPSHR